MKGNKPATCPEYGTRSQGVCPFDYAGGICRACPESITAFGVAQNITSENSSRSNSANLITRKIKRTFLFLANSLKKWTQFLISWKNNRRHNSSPCVECIKLGGVCQPQCEKRRSA